MRNISIMDFAYLPAYEKQISQLSKLARPERWDYMHDHSNFPQPILRNFINHTYRRLTQLQKQNPAATYILVNHKFACFNTGLFTKNFESIYALFDVNSTNPQKKILKGFYKESAFELKNIATLPDKAEFFSNITEVYYDTKFDLRVNIDHILEDEENKKRIPEQYRNAPNLAMIFRSMAIDYAKIRIKENYKAAVPQYFNGRVQFLIPISLGDPAIVDLALAVNRDGNIYSGRTCLTLDMAYNNARLIAKPETDWL